MLLIEELLETVISCELENWTLVNPRYVEADNVDAKPDDDAAL